MAENTGRRLKTQEKPEEPENAIDTEQLPASVSLSDDQFTIGDCELWVEEVTNFRDVISQRRGQIRLFFQNATLVYPDGRRPEPVDLRIESEAERFEPGAYKLSVASLGVDRYKALTINSFTLGLVRVGDLPAGWSSSLTPVSRRPAADAA